MSKSDGSSIDKEEQPLFGGRAEAVNLARNVLEDSAAGNVTIKGVVMLARAVIEMDAALLQHSATTALVTDAMVDRFLAWKLPEDFHPDAGISFSPYFNVEYNAKQGKPPQRHDPTGTNLLTATQARAMLEHVLASTQYVLEKSSGG